MLAAFDCRVVRNVGPQRNMKYYFTLTLALVIAWLLWSGYFLANYFLLILGAMSCLFCIWISKRMKIVDEEGAPVQLGIRPFTSYLPWLAKEIIVSNIEVARIILSPKMKLQRNMVDVHINQKSEIGRVIMANSITLTPGTVSVNLEGDQVQVHALSFEGAEEDLSGEMDRRVCKLEPKGK